MKRIMRGIIGPTLWASRPVRRAIMGWFDARIVRLISTAIEARVLPSIAESVARSEERLERIETLVANSDRSASRVVEDVGLSIGGLTREVFRMQAKLEMLRSGLEAKAADDPGVGGLSLLTESSGETINRRVAAPIERSRVG